MFHTTVAKLLFLAKRSRPDLLVAVAFLCSRVKSPDIDDYKKLARVIKNLRMTKDLHLVIGCDDLHRAVFYIDVAYGVHPDMKSHTGACLTFGKGMLYSTSAKQKLNARSSTEGELIGIHDILPQVIWTGYFMESQGYKLRENIILQDNNSTILLAKNGRRSSGKRTRHVQIRYFFIHDRLEKHQELCIKYCPTEQMTSDYLSKPTQGRTYRKHRDAILNYKDVWLNTESTVHNHRSVLDDVRNCDDAKNCEHDFGEEDPLMTQGTSCSPHRKNQKTAVMSADTNHHKRSEPSKDDLEGKDDNKNDDEREDVQLEHKGDKDSYTDHVEPVQKRVTWSSVSQD